MLQVVKGPSEMVARDEVQYEYVSGLQVESCVEQIYELLGILNSTGQNLKCIRMNVPWGKL